jgi:arginyl-tRNA--protein-N-Asp/Glu arginylyltransferase
LSGNRPGILGYRGNRESRPPSGIFSIRDPKPCEAYNKKKLIESSLFTRGLDLQDGASYQFLLVLGLRLSGQMYRADYNRHGRRLYSIYLVQDSHETIRKLCTKKSGVLSGSAPPCVMELITNDCKTLSYDQ